MKRLIILGVALLAAGAAFAKMGDVVASFPAPAKRDAFRRSRS